MYIQRFETNAKHSRAVAAAGLVFLSGQVGDGPEGDIATQTRQALAKIDSLLTTAGSSRSKILSATVWLQRIEDHEEMNRVWEEWLPPGTAPARAMGGLNLPGSGLLVEIVVTALAGT